MKRTPLLFTAILCLFGELTLTRGQEPSALQPASIEAGVPACFYCEIISNHLPSYRGDGVLFDFGQQTDAWAYNWLTDAEGRKLVFGSGIEALNYMVCRGWEFVQAYTSGDENQTTHFLLRIASAHLSDAEKRLLLAEPRPHRETPEKPKRGKR